MCVSGVVVVGVGLDGGDKLINSGSEGAGDVSPALPSSRGLVLPDATGWFGEGCCCSIGDASGGKSSTESEPVSRSWSFQRSSSDALR